MVKSAFQHSALALLALLVAGCTAPRVTGDRPISDSASGSLVFSFETVRNLDDTALCVVQGLNQAWASAGQEHEARQTIAGQEYEIRPKRDTGPEARQWSVRLTPTGPQTSKIEVFATQTLDDDTQNRLLNGTDVCKD